MLTLNLTIIGPFFIRSVQQLSKKKTLNPHDDDYDEKIYSDKLFGIFSIWRVDNRAVCVNTAVLCYVCAAYNNEKRKLWNFVCVWDSENSRE